MAHDEVGPPPAPSPAGPADPRQAGAGTAPVRRRLPTALWAGLGALLVGLAACEQQGWPFLAGPVQHFIAQRLDRGVSLDDETGSTFRLRLLGGIRLDLGQLRIDNPDWSQLGPMLQARNLQMTMRWTDALRWRPGRRLVLGSVSADSLALRLQRLADGRASWALGPQTDPAASPAPPLADLVSVDRLVLRHGTLQLLDAPQQIDVAVNFATNGDLGAPLAAATGASKAGGGTAAPASGAVSSRPADAAATTTAAPRLAAHTAGPAIAAPRPAGTASAASSSGLSASAEGRYRQLPLRATLTTGDLGEGWGSAADAPGLPVTLRLRVGRAEVDFNGQVRQLLGERQLQGQYRVAGPSLAAVGEPVGLTLPQTRHFSIAGRLVQDARHVYTVVDQAVIGRSRLAGEFTFTRRPGAVPLLAGRLHGSALQMQDLGPAVGGATDDGPKPTKGSGRVLPDRAFDLPSLRAMDANILVALDRFDFGTAQLQAAAPLSAHLLLQGGLLQLNELDARLAQGRLSGHVRLDGRQALAQWDVDLQGRGLLLEQWLRPVQRANGPPYATGRLGGRVLLTGQGRSTAELLASANGRIQLHWTRGTVSHLLVEAAGLDIAQGLGVLVRGDNPLTVDCGAGDLLVKAGQVTPQVLLVDTADSTIWLDGQLSLASERLALVAHVQPKDWSPLALRAPLHIDGVMGAPVLSLDKPALLRRVLPAALLAMINPLAGLLPLIDPGTPADGGKVGSCRAVAERYRQASGQ